MQHPGDRRWVRTVAVASLLAGAIHAVVFEGHVREWWAHGVFFLVVALGQILFGLALLTDAINVRHFGPGANRAMRVVHRAAVLGNLAVIAVYVWSRTLGVPIGPEAGKVEPADALGILSVLAEAVVVVGCLRLLGRGARAPRPER